MRSLVFSVTASQTFIGVAPDQRVIFYGADLIVIGSPLVVQFLDTIPTPLSPQLNNLIVGIIHHLPVLYDDGIPIARAVGAKGSHGGILITGGTAPNVSGTVYYDVG